MSWLSRNNFTPSDRLHADDLNNLANDQRTWGGDVNGGGHVLSNVTLVGVSTAASPVSSVFGRIGDVVAQSGDYTAAQVGAVPTARQVIAGPGLSGGGPLSADVTLNALVTSVFGRTGAVALTPADINSASGVTSSRQIATGTGLSGGGNLSADRTLVVVPDTTNQQVQVQFAGSVVGTRRAINLINGANITIAAVDNNANNSVDITVASTGGGGGGMTDPTSAVGDLIVRGPVNVGRLPVGTNGQVLTADSTQSLGVRWAAASGGGSVGSVFGRTGAVVATAGDYTAAMVTNAVSTIWTYPDPAFITSLAWAKIINVPAFMQDPTSSKGDLIVHGATTTRLPIGADGSILIADSAQTLGVRWGTAPASVGSVFGRTGVVVAAAGDYDASQITNAVATSRTINTGTGLSGGGNLSADRTLSVVPDTTNQQLQVLNTGTNIGTRHAINFISGSNVSLSIADDAANNRVNITVASSGGSGGLVDPTTTIGDLIVRGPSAVQRLGAGLNGQVLTVDSSVSVGLKWAYVSGGGGGSQSPWTSDIEGANFNLNNVGAIGVNGLSSSTARIKVTTTGTSEDALAALSTNAAGYASLALTNNSGDTLRIRNYGSSYATNPETVAIESSVPLRLLANSAEVMRLASGHVMIGTATDDGVNLLQVAGKIKSAAGYVFPDGTLQTTASTPATAPVTSVYGRTGAVVAASGDYTASQVTNAVSTAGSYADPVWLTSLAYSKLTGAPAAGVSTVFGRAGAVVATAGDYNASQVTNAVSTTSTYADPAWITSLNYSKVSGTPSGAQISQMQTPWLSDIDGNSKTLKSVFQIGIGIVPIMPLHVTAAAADSHVLVDVPQQTTYSPLVTFRIQSTSVWNAGVDATDGNKFKIATGGVFNNFAAGTKLTITSAGLVGIGKNPSFQMDIAGDCNLSAGSVYRVNGVPLATGSQTPWTSNIDGGGFALTNTGQVTIKGPRNQPFGQLTLQDPATTYAAGVGGQIGFSFIYGGASYAVPVTITGLKENSTAGDYSAYLAFSTCPNTGGPVERMRITSAGAVGIGNAGVAPDGNAGNVHMILGPNGTSTGEFTICTNSASPTVCGALEFANYANAGTDKRVGAILCNNEATINSGFLQFFTANGGSITEKMRLTAAGFVGIGTSAPNCPLTINTALTGPVGLLRLIVPNAVGNHSQINFSVAGSIDVAQIQALYSASSSIGLTFSVFNGSLFEAMRISSAGYVGIGTTNPKVPLHAFGPYAASPSTSTWTDAFAVNTSNNLTLGIGGSNVSPYPLWLQGSDKGGGAGGAYPIVLNPVGGSVGIGLMNPNGSYKLDVAGDVNCTGAFRVNGNLIMGFTNQANQSRTFGTVYQNTTGKVMGVSVNVYGNNGGAVAACDPTNPPSTNVGATGNGGATNVNMGMTFFVLPGYYYKVNNAGGVTTLQSWTEWW